MMMMNSMLRISLIALSHSRSFQKIKKTIRKREMILMMIYYILINKTRDEDVNFVVPKMCM